jgi:hypothetical protein
MWNMENLRKVENAWQVTDRKCTIHSWARHVSDIAGKLISKTMILQSDFDWFRNLEFWSSSFTPRNSKRQQFVDGPVNLLVSLMSFCLTASPNHGVFRSHGPFNNTFIACWNSHSHIRLGYYILALRLTEWPFIMRLNVPNKQSHRISLPSDIQVWVLRSILFSVRVWKTPPNQIHLELIADRSQLPEGNILHCPTTSNIPEKLKQVHSWIRRPSL